MALMVKLTAPFALALAALAGCGGSSQTAASSSSSSSLENSDIRAKLRTMALAASQADGVASPTSIRAAGPLYHEAAEQALSGDIVNDHALVFAIVIEGGTFVDNSASGPPGSTAPQGSVLTFDVDAQTFEVLDSGLSNNQPNWSLLGSNIVDL